MTAPWDRSKAQWRRRSVPSMVPFGKQKNMLTGIVTAWERGAHARGQAPFRGRLAVGETSGGSSGHGREAQVGIALREGKLTKL